MLPMVKIWGEYCISTMIPCGDYYWLQFRRSIKWVHDLLLGLEHVQSYTDS